MRADRRLLLCRGATAAAAVAAPWLVGCAPEPPLTVAYHPWPGYAALRLADSLGWWEGEPLRSLPTGSASASLQAMRDGKAQAAGLTLDEVLTANANGLPLRIIGLFDLSHGADVVLARPGFDTPLRWPGARVGHENGAVGELMLVSWLEHSGLPLDAVQQVHVPFDQHERVWRAGGVDLLVTFEPTASRLIAQGARRVFDSRELPAQRPIADVLAVHARAMREQRSALRTLLRHVLAGRHHLLSLPDDAAYRLATWLDLPPAHTLHAFSGLRLANWADNRHWLLGGPPPLLRAARTVAQFMHQQGLAPHPDVPDDLVSALALPVEEPE
ncbi:MAG: ABC transporter substrate-binding protein [Tepidimonas sp.]